MFIFLQNFASHYNVGDGALDVPLSHPYSCTFNGFTKLPKLSNKPCVKQYKINDQQKRQNAKKLPNTLYSRLFLLFSLNKFLDSVRSVFFVHLVSYCWIEHIIDVDVAVFFLTKLLRVGLLGVDVII